MALVQVTDVEPMDNPTFFHNPFTFEVTFECSEDLEEDLEWKLVYVGSAEDHRHDQLLVEVMVGPVPQGVNKFVLHGSPPNAALLPDVLGVTVVLLTCAYRNKEFVRIGYYVNNEINSPDGTEPQEKPREDDETLGFFSPRRKTTTQSDKYIGQDDDDMMMSDDDADVDAGGPQEPIDIAQVYRTILADQPRVRPSFSFYFHLHNRSLASPSTGHHDGHSFSLLHL